MTESAIVLEILCQSICKDVGSIQVGKGGGVGAYAFKCTITTSQAEKCNYVS